MFLFRRHRAGVGIPPEAEACYGCRDSALDKGDDIFRKDSSEFGPGDIYCSMWGLLGLAGMGEAEWTPQYNYWKQPIKLDDGGLNVL